MAKYIGYARVSGSSQDNRRQEVYLHARAVEHGLPLEIVQEKKSGASLDRQVREIIERLQPGDILGFWITSRFGRPEPEDVGVYFEWAKQARSKGAIIEIDKKVLNTTTVDGVKKFLDELLEAYNERIAIVARTLDGKRLARSDGEYRGFGWMPWGYRKCIKGYDENGEPIRGYEHHPEQVEMVRDLYQWIIDGKKLADFQSMVMAKGDVKTARGKVRGWHKGSLQYMLFNPLNMGYAFARAGDANRLVAKNLVMSHLGDMSIFVKATLYPPIVPPETYWKAVETYTVNRRAVYTGNLRTGEDVFTRTVYCRWCYKHGKSSAFYVNHAKRGDQTKA
jgi:DNA invertase Pin-like site-specific DNA recombinase